MAKTFSILFGQLVDVVTLECSVLYFTPIKTMHSAWKCFCLHGVRRTCYCIYAIERVAFPTHKSSLSFQELFSPGESGRHFQWLSVKMFTLFAACHEETCEMSCLHRLTPSFNVVWLLHAFKGSCPIFLGDWQLGLFKGDNIPPPPRPRGLALERLNVSHLSVCFCCLYLLSVLFFSIFFVFICLTLLTIINT